MTSYKRDKLVKVRNDSSFPIFVKEYCPNVFSFFREQCEIGCESVLSSLHSYWLDGSDGSHHFEILVLTRREKQRIIELVRCFIAVGVSSTE